MSCTKANLVKATRELVASFEETCKQNGVSQQKLLTQLLEELGLESTGVIRCKKQVIELTDDIINFLKEEEKKKAVELADYNANFKSRRPKKEVSPIDGEVHYKTTIKDRNLSKYIILQVLTSFDCYRDNCRLSKTDIILLLGYKERTMYYQNAEYESNFTIPSNPTGRIFSALRSEILTKFDL